MASPGRLAVDERPAASPARNGTVGPAGGSAPLVVLVHGSLDRGASFGRVRRRLADLDTLTYDRRGYHGSRDGRPLARGLADHVEDLIEVIGGREAVVAGHSYGGNVALGAALDRSGGSIRALAVYEPPQPWLRRQSVPHRADGRIGDPSEEDPATAAERFFRRMVGDDAWERLTEAEKEARRADGPALAAELAAIRIRRPPFDVARLRVPVVYGRGELSLPHHRAAVAWLVEHTPDAELVEIAGARHGAHLTHPDAFATMVRRAVELAGRPSGTPSPAH